MGDGVGEYDSFITALLSIGSTTIAYDFWRTSKIVGTPPCLYPNGTVTGTCQCFLESEEAIVTGSRGKVRGKMVRDIQYDFQVDPVTLRRLGVLVTLTYKSKGPNAGYL